MNLKGSLLFLVCPKNIYSRLSKKRLVFERITARGEGKYCSKRRL